MAGQPAAPQLAISVLAAPPRRTEAKIIAGPPPKISTFRRLQRRISTFSSAFSLQLEGCAPCTPIHQGWRRHYRKAEVTRSGCCPRAMPVCALSHVRSDRANKHQPIDFAMLAYLPADNMTCLLVCGTDWRITGLRDQERRQLRIYFVVAALRRQRSSLPGRQV